MRLLLAIISIVALVLAVIGISGPSQLTPPSLRSTFFAGGLAAFAVFVIAGAASAALDHLLKLRREAEKQTALLERMARNATARIEEPASGRIPGING